MTKFEMPPQNHRESVPGIQATTRKIDSLIRVLPRIVENPWRELSSPEQVGLIFTTYLTEGSNRLQTIYTSLQKRLDNPDLSFSEKLPAMMLAEGLLEQTGLEPEQRAAIKSLTPDLGKSGVNIIDALARRDQPNQETDEVIEAIGRRVYELITTMPIPDLETQDDVLREYLEVDHMYKLYTETALGKFWIDMGNQEVKEKFLKICRTRIVRAIAHPLSRHLLDDPEINLVDEKVRYLTWFHAMEQAVAPEEGFPNEDEGRKRGDYFLGIAEIQKLFWQGIITDSQRRKLPEFLSEEGRANQIEEVPPKALIASWFFHQDSATRDTFFTSLLAHNEGQQSLIVQKVIAWIGIFQSLHPEHPHIPDLQEKLSQIETEDLELQE